MTPTIRRPSERLEEAHELAAGAMARFKHLHEAAIAKERNDKVKITEGAAVRFRAPWDDETIARLNAHQHDDRFHPYTCGNDSRHILVATREGWKCPECDYSQNWAH